MPPKKEAKKAETPTKAAPIKGGIKETPKKEATKKEAPKSNTPRKPKDIVKYESLAQDKNATLPVEVTFAGGNAQAKLVKATYQHNLKLEASAPFRILNTYTINEGNNEGLQIIVLQPAKAFKFSKLPVEARQRVFKFYFYPKGIAGDPITLDGKRKTEGKDPFAKTYCEGSKYRVALLAVNKEINKAAMPFLYANPLRFDTPVTLMNFFAGIESHLRIHLRHIEIRQYVKKDAKTALAFLAEAKNLECLRIDQNIASEDDASKAAKSFWLDASKLLEAVGATFEKKKFLARKPRFQNEVEEEDESDEEASGEDGESDDEGEDGDDEGSKAGVFTSSEKEPSTSVDAESDANTDAMDTVKHNGAVAVNDASNATPKKPSLAATETPKQKLVQGEKSFAVDILQFGKSAFKNKNGTAWDNKKKQIFLDVLEARLNLFQLSYWTCICGKNVYGHSCTEELRGRNKTVAETSQFEHLGHGGAEMINAAYGQGS